MGEPATRRTRVRSQPSLGWGAGACLVAAGWVIGLRPLVDNSFFTHLATGRIILETGSVPSTDPYTFTAHGESWVVQSWLASLLYATVEALSGAVGLRVLMGAVAALLAAVAWRLTRSAESLVVRLGLGVLFVAASAELWSERPFMLGLVALGCVVLAADRAIDPRWLVPIGWVWVNVHGSFPLGLAYLVALALGTRLDGRHPTAELRTLAWLGGGVLLGAVGPLGPRVLVFPVQLLQRQEVLQNVIEWRAPTFDSFSQRMFLIQLVVAILVLVRRPSYRRGLVLALFVAAALLGARNVAVAALVILPGIAEATPAVGSLRSGARSSLGVGLSAVGMIGAVLLGSARLGQGNYEFGGYPVDAVAYLEHEEIDLERVHLATQDVVGNYLELVRGPGRAVFYDDRFDMFPLGVSEANVTLVRGGPSLRSDLAAFDVDLVLWDRGSSTAQRLVADPGWRLLYSDDGWIVTCRRGAVPGGRLGRC